MSFTLTILAAVAAQAQPAIPATPVDESRCYVPPKRPQGALRQIPSNCPEGLFNDNSSLEPSVRPALEIPIQFHVITDPSTSVLVTDQRITDQMNVLNEAFSSPIDSGLRFVSVGTNRVTHAEWAIDQTDSVTGLEYWEVMASDPLTTVNVYILDNPNPDPMAFPIGYVTELPGAPNSPVGMKNDRIVVQASTVGDEWMTGLPASNFLGRTDGGMTLVHEVGHYLGLEHVFQRQPTSSCSALWDPNPDVSISGPGTNAAFNACQLANPDTSGDLIADTPPIWEQRVYVTQTTEQGLTYNNVYNNIYGYQIDVFGVQEYTCRTYIRRRSQLFGWTEAFPDYSSSPYEDSFGNYMSYSDDVCVSRFTPGQHRRMRCTIDTYRPMIATPIGPRTAAVYCEGNRVNNSTGKPSILEPNAFSTASLAQNDLTLELRDLPGSAFYIPLLSRMDGNIVGTAASPLCIELPIARLLAQVGQTSPSGTKSIPIDWNNLPDPAAPGSNASIMIGETWFMQVWHRDVGASNTTTGVRITVE